MKLAGTAMFVLLVVHNVFNRRWYGTVARTREPRGLINVGLTFLLLAGMLALLVTSVLISNTLAGLLPVLGRLHRPADPHLRRRTGCSSSSSIHLGLRWPMIMGVARSLLGIATPEPGQNARASRARRRHCDPWNLELVRAWASARSWRCR